MHKLIASNEAQRAKQHRLRGEIWTDYARLKAYRLKSLKMPTRPGMRLQPTFESLVLVSKNARIGRPKEFDTSRVLKSDQLQSWITKHVDSGSPLMMAKVVGMETLTGIAQQLVALHRPLVPDYRAKFGVTEAMLQPAERTVSVPNEAPNGKAAGGEFRMSPKFGPHFLWPEDLTVKRGSLARTNGINAMSPAARYVENDVRGFLGAVVFE